jgi:hypothetical protein
MSAVWSLSSEKRTLRQGPFNDYEFPMSSPRLILKRAATSASSGIWGPEDYDVIAAGLVVGRLMKTAAAPEASPWFWTLAYGTHKDRTPTHGYAATLEAAMAAFAKSWRRE